MRILVAAACLAASLWAQDPPTVTRFEFDAAGERRAQWSVGGLRRNYFDERLPALFTRTLRLDEPLAGGASLDWIFTGAEGGVTVHIESRRVRLTQRYYDSYAHFPARPPKTRYPERIWDETGVELSAAPREIELVMDHKLSARLRVDGREVARQTCLMEMRRHQLAWAPPHGVTGGKLSGEIRRPAAGAAGVRVNPAAKRQTIYGFGGILSVPAWISLSEEGKRRWWDLLAEYNLWLHREYPNGYRLKPDLSNFDRLEDASPHYYGDNFPNGEISDFAYIREIRRRGGKVLFEFWDLPAWAKREHVAADGKRYPNAPDYGEYVRAMVGYCQISKEKTGAPPDVVGIQNEIVQPAEVWHGMIRRLRAALDEAGFHAVRIHMPDHSNLRGGTQAALAIRQSPEAWKLIDWAATHVYDYQSYFEDPDGYDRQIRAWREAAGDKPFLSTEFTVNHSAYQSWSYRTAFAQAQLYHKNMALMDASALIYCWTLLDVEQRSFGATRSLFVPDPARGFVPVPSSHQLRVFGAFSRRLPEGMWAP